MNRNATVFAIVLAFTGATAHAGIEVVIAEGDVAPGTAGLVVSTLNAPFTTGDGRVGFTGAVIGSNFVWFDAAVTWLNTDGLPFVLTGAESTMGVSDAGRFIYSPSVDGNDAVWTDAGLLLREDDPAPDFPGQLITFCSRPTMLPDGTAYFVSGLNPAKGGATLRRVLYRADAGGISKVIASGDPIEGFVVDSPSGVGFDYDHSDDGAHEILSLVIDTGSSTNDDVIAVDGVIVARESFPTGDGDNWDNFDSVSINNGGRYVFAGDTDGASTSDEFIAVNSSIAIREGDDVGCTTLAGAAVLGLSVNDDGTVAHAWSISGGHEMLFVGQSGSLAATSRIVLQTGDEVDSDGDGNVDSVIVDFNASNIIGPGYELAEDGFVHAEVDLEPIGGGDGREAIVRVALPDFSCPADFDHDGMVGFQDLLLLLQAWGPCPGCPLDLDGDCMVGFSEIVALLAAWGACP